MYALISMAVSLALLAVLLRVKVRLGRAMVLSAFGLALLLQVTPGEFRRAAVDEWNERPLDETTGSLFVTLTVLLTLVNVLGTAMRETGVSQRLVPALQGLFRSRRVALAGIPLMMGLLPTPGGIMLSAPMVRDLGDHIGVNRSHSAAINFLFRHQWETVWPLFPAVPLIQSMFGISALALISYNIVIPLAGVIGGVVFLLLAGIPPRDPQKRPAGSVAKNLHSFAHAFWPIGIIAALYAGFDLSPTIGILLATIGFFALHRVPVRSCWTIFKSAVEPDFALLVLGALLFKLTLQAGGAIPAVVEFLTEMEVPGLVLIFLLPMLVSFLTGVTMPTVAITFPFLMPFIGTGSEANIALESLAFSGLICGLLITPVHLCLALSASYFEAPLTRIILKLLGPVIFVAAAGIAMALWLG